MSRLPNQNIYRLYAPIYDRIFSRVLGRMRRMAIEQLEMKPGDRLLIPGVGTGLDLPLIPPGVQVTAGDISPEMLAQARRKTQSRDVTLEMMDALKLEYSDGSFDAVLFNLLLSVVPNGPRAFREGWRVLRPGGKMAIADKFLPEGQELTGGRKLLGAVIRALGTDPNRRFSEICAGVSGLRVCSDEPVLLGGQYRVLLLEKDANIL